ncbi:hypothetical protein BDU57DRAFT_520936 [Ampelomyces quisqualis]|uniref:Uncharacterized protein n=1 Tax=Ampelomyces quisqualis TaxID=50730 RepID=A0A6A5QER9_AMPQU|nr:hypothetical protein BDU57DRAFT_520936 [Ampelomyces quisqualis]
MHGASVIIPSAWAPWTFLASPAVHPCRADVARIAFASQSRCSCGERRGSEGAAVMRIAPWGHRQACRRTWRTAPSSQGLGISRPLRTRTSCAESRDPAHFAREGTSGTNVLMLALCHPKALLRTHPRSKTCCAGARRATYHLHTPSSQSQPP